MTIAVSSQVAIQVSSIRKVDVLSVVWTCRCRALSYMLFITLKGVTIFRVVTKNRNGQVNRLKGQAKHDKSLKILSLAFF